MATQELPAQFALFRLITGYHLSCAVHVAVKLGLAGLLADGPRHYTDLAGATGTHASSLKRMPPAFSMTRRSARLFNTPAAECRGDGPCGRRY